MKRTSENYFLHFFLFYINYVPQTETTFGFKKEAYNIVTALHASQRLVGYQWTIFRAVKEMVLSLKGIG